MQKIYRAGMSIDPSRRNVDRAGIKRGGVDRSGISIAEECQSIAILECRSTAIVGECRFTTIVSGGRSTAIASGGRSTAIAGQCRSTVIAEQCRSPVIAGPLLCIDIEILLSCAQHSRENFVGNLAQIIPHVINLRDVVTCLRIEDRATTSPPMTLAINWHFQ
jgi:hypothetical protein